MRVKGTAIESVSPVWLICFDLESISIEPFLGVRFPDAVFVRGYWSDSHVSPVFDRMFSSKRVIRLRGRGTAANHQ